MISDRTKSVQITPLINGASFRGYSVSLEIRKIVMNLRFGKTLTGLKRKSRSINI